MNDQAHAGLVWWTKLVPIALTILLSGCVQPRPIHVPGNLPIAASAKSVSSIQSLTPLRTISVFQARLLLRLAGVKGIPVGNPVDCYRMRYSLVRPDGKTVQLSGLLALPHGVPAHRLVSFQHGTTTTRNAVPSQLDGTGLAAAIVFGGNGYALVAPDYPGLGESEGRHPYYVSAEIGPAVAAMIEAAQQLDSVPGAPVFLSGFSEGGWASLAALRVMEREGKPVLGSAQVAGAYDLRGLSLSTALKGGALSHSLYLAYAAWGQSAHYGQPLESVMTPEYATLVGRIFSGARPREILRALPPDPRRMFNQGFLDAFDHDGPNWFLDALKTNTLDDATPHAPVRLYYGSMDQDVVPEEALSAARGMRSRGADALALDVGPKGHDQSMRAAAPLILTWLRELEGRAK